MAARCGTCTPAARHGRSSSGRPARFCARQRMRSGPTARHRQLRSQTDYNLSVPAKRRAAAVSPLNFRMPRELRARLRKFAEARHLGESEALRLIISDHLAEVDEERELELAERW